MYALIAWVVAILVAVAGFVYLYLTWNFNYWRKRGLHTAEPLTIFGSLPNLFTRKRNFILDIHDIFEKYKHDNNAVGIFVTRSPQILLLHPKLIHEVLVTKFTQFRDTITSTWVDDRKEDKMVSRNPFWCAGEEWKQRRSDGMAGLTQNRLKQSYAIWLNSCDKLNKFLEEKFQRSENGVIEVRDISFRFCADVLCDFIWGIDSGALRKPDEPNTINNITRKWTSYSFHNLGCFPARAIAPIVRYLRPRRFFPKDTDEFFLKLQRDAVELRKRDPKPERIDFLNYLLKLGERKGATLEDFAGHSLTVLLDGYHTTATVLMHALFYLGTYPQPQEKLRLEIRKALKEENGSLSYEKMMGLPYLGQCVNESLRLTSAIPIFNRICVEPTTLEISEGTKIDVAKGMVAIIPAYSIHRDEQYFHEPLTFNPERFDNSAHIDLTKQGIFLPFGDGPRICMGTRVALMSIRSTLVEILSKYELRQCPLTMSGSREARKDTFIMSLPGDVWLQFQKL